MLYTGAALGIVGAAGVLYWNREYVVSQISTIIEGAKDAPLADPSIQELRSALGPNPGEGAITLIVALEHVLVNRDWDRRYGHRIELRPGVKEFLQQVAEAGAVLTVWSDNPSHTGTDTLMRLGAELGIPLQVTQLQLGSEHTFYRPGEPHRREKHLEHFNRSPGSILLVDYDPLSLDLNPDRCIIVKKMAPPHVEDGPRDALTQAQVAQASIGQSVRRGEPDVTLQAIASVVKRIRADSATYGVIDVPASINRLRTEAALSGFSSDAEGLSEYLAHTTAVKTALDVMRVRTGFGGLLRDTLDNTPYLRRKATTIEAAAARPFRNPALYLNPESLLAEKVQAANAKFDAMMRMQQQRQ